MKVSFGDPSARKSGKGRRSGAALPARRVRTEDGGMQTIYTVDAHSATVGEDILALFRLNVARARRETREAMKHRGIAAE